MMRPSGRPPMPVSISRSSAPSFLLVILLPSRAFLLRKRSELCCRLALSAAEASASWGCFIFAGSLRFQRHEGDFPQRSQSDQTGPRRTAASARDFRGEPCELAACKTLARLSSTETSRPLRRRTDPSDSWQEAWPSRLGRCGLGMRTALSLCGRIAHKAKLRAPRPARHRAIYAWVSADVSRRETAAVKTTTAPK